MSGRDEHAAAGRGGRGGNGDSRKFSMSRAGLLAARAAHRGASGRGQNIRGRARISRHVREVPPPLPAVVSTPTPPTTWLADGVRPSSALHTQSSLGVDENYGAPSGVVEPSTTSRQQNQSNSAQQQPPASPSTGQNPHEEQPPETSRRRQHNQPNRTQQQTPTTSGTGDLNGASKDVRGRQ